MAKAKSKFMDRVRKGVKAAQDSNDPLHGKQRRNAAAAKKLDKLRRKNRGLRDRAAQSFT